MTVDEWLDTALYKDRPHPLVKERLAELIYKNGGRYVSGWGAIASGGPYGETGLDQDDALELIHLNGVVDGFHLAHGGTTLATVASTVREEWAKKGADIEPDPEEKKRGRKR